MTGSLALYERYGDGYARHRRPDARIARIIEAALGASRSVVNVGAGGGSYEPDDRYVIAIEPSPTMRAERRRGLPPAVAARAEDLPLDDDAVDAALAVLTLHHWADRVRGLREMRRVASGPVVILTFDPRLKRRFWLQTDYLPEVTAADQVMFPPPQAIVRTLGGGRVEPVPIPADCEDGFLEAYYGSPEAYLDPARRRAQSAWGRLPADVEQRTVSALAADLESGAWDRRHGDLRTRSSYDAGLRLVVSEGARMRGSRS